jgi:hypothetical protein
VRRRSEAGFTALEFTVAVGIITATAALVFGRVLEVREEANRVECDVYRDRVEEGEVAFTFRRHRASGDPRELVEDGVLPALHACRSGGHYDWLPFPSDDARFHRQYGCSVHGWPEQWGNPSGLRPEKRKS